MGETGTRENITYFSITKNVLMSSNLKGNELADFVIIIIFT